jgi:hypothetical protein
MHQNQTDELFSPLERELEDRRQRYREKIEPIRSEYIAHLAVDPSAPLSTLFEKTTSDEVTDLLEFPLRLHRALWMFYRNGLAPRLDPLSSKARLDIRNSLTSVAQRLAAL